MLRHESKLGFSVKKKKKKKLEETDQLKLETLKVLPFLVIKSVL